MYNKREAKLLEKLPQEAQELFKKHNFLLLGEFFDYAKEYKGLCKQTKFTKIFIQKIEKQKEECPFEYKALDFYDDKLIRERLNNPRDKLKVELYGDYFKDDENYFQIIIKYKNQRK